MLWADEAFKFFSAVKTKCVYGSAYWASQFISGFLSQIVQQFKKRSFTLKIGIQFQQNLSFTFGHTVKLQKLYSFASIKTFHFTESSYSITQFQSLQSQKIFFEMIFQAPGK